MYLLIVVLPLSSIKTRESSMEILLRNTQHSMREKAMEELSSSSRELHPSRPLFPHLMIRLLVSPQQQISNVS